MRFERLYLRAFGPFTEDILDLSGGAPGGVHVVYGPNEAGKSTSLRAVAGFLFGIPHRTGDAHLHPMNKLQVGADLSHQGEAVSLVRLKRNKDDLVDTDGRPVAVDPLPHFLGNVDERSFSSRFGLDQAELERGAEALLGGSEQGLFAAGTAGATVRRVMEDLGARADELYRPRGSKPLLNRALTEHERASRDARRAERPPEKWLEQKRAHEDVVARVTAVKSSRSRVRAELRRLNRLRAVLSDLTARNAALSRRRQLGAAPSLPANATETRQACESQLAEARVEEKHLRRELADYESELASLPPDSPLAEVDDEQLQLSTRTGTALSARMDLPKRQASLLEQSRQVSDLLADVGVTPEPNNALAEARQRLPSPRTVSLVRRLSTEYGALVTAVEAAEATYSSRLREVERLEEAPSGDVLSAEELSVIEAVIADAQAVQPLLLSIVEDQRTILDLAAQCERIRVELLIESAWRQLAPLLPSPTDIASAARQVEETSRRRDEVCQRISVQRTEVSRLALRQQELEQADIPSEDKLLEARRQRDAQLETIEQRGVQGDSLAELRVSIASTDQLADRLRREAHRVAELARLRRDSKEKQGDIEALQKQLAIVENEAGSARAFFSQLSDRLQLRMELGPRNGVEIVDRLRHLVDAESKREALQAAVVQKEQRVAEHERRLGEVTAAEAREAGLAALLAAATRRHRQATRTSERVEQRADELQRARTALHEVDQERLRSIKELSGWRERWAAAVRPLGLPEDTSVSAAEDVLSTFEKMGRVLQEAGQMERRIAGMQRDTKSLADAVREILRRHQPSLLELDPVDAAVQLQEEIRTARRVSEDRSRIKKLIFDRRAALSKVETVLATATRRLDELVRLASVDSPSDLPRAEDALREIRGLDDSIQSLERAIRERSDGASFDELDQEAKPWKGRGSQLNQRVHELEEEMESLEDQLRQAESDEAGTKMGLDRYHSEDVADARQRATTRASEARALLREYLVRSAALSLLQGQMETYAERFAGPIVGRASELFEKMTLGRYKRLSVGLGERTLRCLQGSDEKDVAQLSRGARAQLYFALRLASLEAYFDVHHPIPLVFDDLFVDFDDDRAAATFEVISELGRRVQIIYFTHLARDVEVAHDAVPPGLLFEHRLGVS